MSARRSLLAPLVVAALAVAASACTALLGANDPIDAPADAATAFDAGGDVPEDVFSADADASTSGDGASPEGRGDAPLQGDTATPPEVGAPDAAAPPAASLSVSPPSVDFGQILVTAVSAPPAVFTVTNTGALPVPGVDVQIPSMDFGIVDTSCAMKTLPPAQSCTVSVVAHPTTVGLRTATMAFLVNNQPLAGASLSVTGTPDVSFTPSSHDFGSVPLGGGPTAEFVFQLQNVSAQTIPTLGLSLPSPFAPGPTDTCNAPLAAGQTCSVGVTFAPTQAGAAAQELTVVGPNAGSALLTGTGAPPVPAGTLVYQGTNLVAWGVTSDGWVVASDAAGVFATPLSGGGSRTGIDGSEPSAVVVSGATVFIWSNPASGPYGKLVVWQSGGAAQVASASSTFEIAAAYGSFLYFLDNATASSADLVRAPASSPATKTVVASGVYADAAGLHANDPSLRASTTGLYAATCAAQTGACALQRFDAAGAATSIAPAVASSWGIDAAGDRVFVASLADPNRPGLVLDASGATVAQIDTAVAGGLLTSSGGDVVYVTAGGALKTSPVASPAPRALFGAAVALWALSPDDKTIAYAASPITTQATSDVWEQPLSVGGPAQLAPAPGTFECFTSTGQHWAWESNVVTTGSFVVGDLWATVAGNGATPIATGVLGARPGPAEMVLWLDHAVTANAPVYFHDDLRDVDTSTGATKLLAAQINFVPVANPAGDTVVYGTDAVPNGTPPGLYAAKLP